MKKSLLSHHFTSSLVWVLLLLAAPVGVWAFIPKAPSGDEAVRHRVEMENGVYRIQDAQDLVSFAELVNGGEYSANALLCADIDMKDADILPIGFGGAVYRGTFDGGSHSIRNLSISLPDADFVGLFGQIGSGAHILNLTLDASCYIEGSAFVGLIGGTNEAGDVLIECVGNEGRVVAHRENAGGIIGCNYGTSATYRISNCYVSGAVSGSLESAAISGWLGNNAVVTYCYSIASVEGVSGTHTFSRDGGNRSASNCYELNGKGLQSFTEKVSAKQVQNGELAALLNTRQDDVWRQTPEQDSHPVLLQGHTLIPGKDADQKPFEIRNATDFIAFARYTDFDNTVSATLLEDVDLKGVDLPVIGTDNKPYCGTFDGNGHVISNLNIVRQGENYVGLFSVIGVGASLRNFTLDKSCYISGGAFVGLVGIAVGNGSVVLDKLGNEGRVVAQNQNAGGLIGCVISDKVRCRISHSYVTGLVKGGYESGAISGWLSVSPTLYNCYSSARVIGVEEDKTFYRYSSQGTVSDCYEVEGIGRQGNTKKVKADDLASGALTLQLNGNVTGESAMWRQNLGQDRYPVLRPSHNVVTAADPSVSFDSSPLLSKLLINEIQVANIDQFVDPSFNYGGWIELYNPTDTPIELDNIFITDDSENSFKFQLPDFFGDVPAKGYRNIWFDHNEADGEYGPEAYKQVPFNLDAEGGTIYLYDAKGQLITSQEYPPAISRCSFARMTVDGEEWGTTGTPTPGYSNEGVAFCTQRLEAPVINTDGRIFDKSFKFKVTIPAGATLRYTTDCSTPTLTNGMQSADGEFGVSPRTIIYRFRLFKDGYLPSEVVTRSFIYRDRTYDLPVISVTTADVNLYGDSLGVYVNGVNGVPGRGVGKSNINMDWERPVNIEYLLPDGTTAINQEASFHVAGGWNRHIYPQRSFKLKAEKQYGLNYFSYPFFDSKPHHRYKALLVRNGGNDTGAGRCQDAIIQELILGSGMYINGQAWQPVQVLFNGGKYYAMMNLREVCNKHYASSNFGYDTDEVDVAELVSGSGLTPLSGDLEAFNALHELSTHINDPGVFDQIKERLDIDECANYMAAECYLGSWDWLTANNNTKVFRSRDDGRFHFVMYDVESAVDNSYAGMWNEMRGNRNIVLSLFNNLCRHSQFRRQFVDAYCLIDGSVFTKERLDVVSERVKKLVAPALANERLSPDASAARVYNIINTRGDRMNYMHNYLNLGSYIDMAFSSNVPDATILLNDVEVPTGKFNGRLYTPFTLTATAPEGYRFLGWSTNGKASSIVSAERSITLNKGTYQQLQALFEPKSEVTTIPLYVNEVSASNEIYVSEYFKKDDWFELYNPTDKDIDIAGMYLSDKSNNWQKYCVPASDSYSTIVPAHSSLVVWADNRPSLTQLHVPFKLSNADGSQLRITSADGSWGNTLTYLEHDAFTTYGRYPDGGAEHYRMTRPTIGHSNYLTTYDFASLPSGADADPSTSLLLALSKGWNWVSHNLADAVSLDVFKPNASLIQSQQSQLSLSADKQWTGSLQYALPSQGYKVQATQDYEVAMKGYAYPVDERPVSIAAGWNWIGAPLAASTNLETALSLYEANEGDRVVGQEGFAVFEDGEWHGSLYALNPGAAYMLKSEKPRCFNWNVLTHHKAHRRVAPPPVGIPDCPWQPDAHAYPDVMNMVVTLSAEEEALSTDGLIVGAFCGDECRGTAILTQGVAFLTVYGQESDQLTFRILDSQLQSYDADQSLTFEPLALHGSCAEPYQLTLGSYTDVSLLPQGNRPVSITYYSLDGKRLMSPQRGVTLQRIRYTNGALITRKVVRN